jgi:hypothetical protein
MMQSIFAKTFRFRKQYDPVDRVHALSFWTRANRIAIKPLFLSRIQRSHHPRTVENETSTLTLLTAATMDMHTSTHRSSPSPCRMFCLLVRLFVCLGCLLRFVFWNDDVYFSVGNVMKHPVTPYGLCDFSSRNCSQITSWQTSIDQEKHTIYLSYVVSNELKFNICY